MKIINLLSQKFRSLKSNSEVLNIFFNTGWLMGERMLRLIISLFIGVWITRYLGAELYGIYSYALSFSIIFNALASFGINNIVIRDLVKYKGNHHELMGTAFFLKLIGGLLSLMISIVALQAINIEFSTKLYIWIISSGTIVSSFNVIDLYFQSQVKSKFIVKANTITLILSSIIKAVLILKEAPLIAFVLMLIFDAICLAIGYLYFYLKNNLSVLNWVFKKSLAKSLLKESWPLILSGIAISLGMRIDQIMLKNYVSASELGYYAVGVRLAELFSFFPMIISQSIYPKIIKIDFETEKKKLQKLIGFVFYLISGIALIVTLVASFTVNILYGIEFEESSIVLQILIWTIPVTYLGIITNRVLTIKGYQKIIFIKQFSLAILNISLNLYLIPKYGIIGAAWATLLADIFINLFLDFIFPKARWIFYVKMKSFLLITK
jgi:O-antigen/teichoic acid export membrane protein